MAAFSIAHGRTAEHAAQLRRGLAQLGPGFCAELCGVCLGEGEYRQRFTAGCGGGSFLSMSGCDYCDGTGLMQGRSFAPVSVREQVLRAGAQASPLA